MIDRTWRLCGRPRNKRTHVAAQGWSSDRREPWDSSASGQGSGADRPTSDSSGGRPSLFPPNRCPARCRFGYSRGNGPCRHDIWARSVRDPRDT